MTRVKLHYHCIVCSWMISKTMLSWKKMGSRRASKMPSVHTGFVLLLTGILLAEISTHQGGKNLHLVRSTSYYFVWLILKQRTTTKNHLGEMLCVCAIKMTDYCLIFYFLLWYLKRWVINPFTAPACKISRLKNAHINTSRQYLMVLWEICFQYCAFL